MNFEIKSWLDGKVLFSLETKSLILCVEAAVKARAGLRNADLRAANFRGANFRGANFRGANLRGADLRGADLRGANLRGADLRGANLWGADLQGANLEGTNLWAANFRGANFRGANFRGAKGLSRLPVRCQTCPRSGSFEAWKKGQNNDIIKLKIPWFARRTANIKNRKCRAELALVTAIYDTKGRPIPETTNGTFCKKIVYRTGKFVSPGGYDANWLEDCSHGIHFFMTKQEAEDW